MSFPPVLLSIVLAAAVGAGLGSVVLAIVVIDWTRFARVVRAETQLQRQLDYVAAARVVGLGRGRILFAEVLPNVLPLIVTLLTVEMGIAVIVEAILSFVGLSVSTDTPTWGGMIAEGRQVIYQVPWLLALPIGCDRRHRARLQPPRRRAPRHARPGAAAMTPVLAVDDLHVAIGRRPPVPLLRGVSLAIAPGEVRGLVGESGAGKSMIARADLRPPARRRADHARHARLRGPRPRGDARSASGGRCSAREIALIPQDPMTSLNPVKRIGEQIATVLRLKLGLSRRAARARALDLLADVAIRDPARVLAAYPHELSGGMRQRILIAIAFCLPAAAGGRRRADHRARRDGAAPDSAPDPRPPASRQRRRALRHPRSRARRQALPDA